MVKTVHQVAPGYSPGSRLYKYFENISIEVRQYVSPLLPGGRGPNKSIQINSPTNPLVLMNVFDGLVGLTGNLFCLHL